MKAAVLAGRLAGGRAYGYRRTPASSDGEVGEAGEAGAMVIVDDEAEIIR